MIGNENKHTDDACRLSSFQHRSEGQWKRPCRWSILDQRREVVSDYEEVWKTGCLESERSGSLNTRNLQR